MPKSIFLVGFMGSGKTTIGKKLASKLNCECLDLDAAIEKAEGLYIRDIIKEKGEGYFREVESHTLRLSDTPKKVIATGGGAPCFHDNMKWMLSKGIVVYIEMDEGMLFSRLKSTDMANRPLIAGLDDDGLWEFIHTKLKERLPYYQEAHIVFRPVSDTIDSLVSAIKSR